MTNLQQRLQQLSLADRKELDEAVEELERFRKANKIKFWIPNEKQESFIRSKNKARLFLGGNRTGKTEAGIVEDISWCLGYRPYLKETDPWYKTPFEPPVHGIITTESLGADGSAKKILEPKLAEFLPIDGFEMRHGNPKKNQQGVSVSYVFRNGSTLSVMSYEQEADKFEGQRYHFWHADEPPPQDIYTAVRRGLTDYSGSLWMTMTPLKEPWVYQSLYQDPYVFTVTSGIRDNIKHTRPWYGEQVETGFLTEEAVSSFERDLKKSGASDGEIKSRLTGEFRFVAGRVVDNFEPKVHCIDPFDVPKHWTRYEAIDPHPKKPWCITFMAVDPDGNKYVYRNLFIKGKVDQIIEAILIERQGIKPRMTIIDPIAIEENANSGESLINDIAKESRGQIICQRASKAKDRGIYAIRASFYFDLQRGIKPKLYIFNTEYDAIIQLRDWVWSDNEIKELARKINDDFPENLYRLLLLGPTYVRGQQEMKKISDRKIIGLGT